MIFVIHLNFNSKILTDRAEMNSSMDPFAASIEYIHSNGLIARMHCFLAQY